MLNLIPIFSLFTLLLPPDSAGDKKQFLRELEFNLRHVGSYHQVNIDYLIYKWASSPYVESPIIQPIFDSYQQ